MTESAMRPASPPPIILLGVYQDEGGQSVKVFYVPQLKRRPDPMHSVRKIPLDYNLTWLTPTVDEPDFQTIIDEIDSDGPYTATDGCLLSSADNLCAHNHIAWARFYDLV